MNAPLPKLISVPARSLVVRDGREIDTAKVDELARSIEEVGLLNPLTVAPGKRGKGGTVLYEVIAGGHRLRAGLKLGWTRFPCLVAAKKDDLRLELARIDENLIRNEGTVLERAEALARRKEIYEELHPQAKRGGDRRSKGARSNGNDCHSFAEDTAAKAGIADRTVRAYVAVAKGLDEKTKAMARKVPGIADDLTGLLELTKLDPEERHDAIRPKALITWAKDRIGQGRYVRNCTEQCVIAVKGKPVVNLDGIPSAECSSLLVAPVGEHSEKPAEFFTLVERICPSQSRHEMHGRKSRPGWVVSGAEAPKEDRQPNRQPARSKKAQPAAKAKESRKKRTGKKLHQKNADSTPEPLSEKPGRCALCHRPKPNGGGVCDACNKKIDAREAKEKRAKAKAERARANKSSAAVFRVNHDGDDPIPVNGKADAMVAAEQAHSCGTLPDGRPRKMHVHDVDTASERPDPTGGEAR